MTSRENDLFVMPIYHKNEGNRILDPCREIKNLSDFYRYALLIRNERVTQMLDKERFMKEEVVLELRYIRKVNKTRKIRHSKNTLI